MVGDLRPVSLPLSLSSPVVLWLRTGEQKIQGVGFVRISILLAPQVRAFGGMVTEREEASEGVVRRHVRDCPLKSVADAEIKWSLAKLKK
jgi:hypothetical protein